MVPLHKKSNLVSKKTGPTSASTSTDNPGIAKKVSCATTKTKKETLKKPHLSEQSAQCSNTVSGEDMDTP
ncbi:hypothetical protein GYH30_026521 [Glycine max]|nr:hypothetical protein GYH30_026521 [Glycine max]